MKTREILNKENFAEFVLSEERTILSKQRTALAFMQTGLAATGIGLLVVKLWIEDAFQIIGVILIASGLSEVAHSYWKLSKYNKRLERVKEMIKNSKWGRVEYGKFDEQE